MEEVAAKPKLNSVDVLIIIVILALAALGVYKLFFVNKPLMGPNGVIEYKILLERVRQPTLENLKKGDALRDVQTNTPLGDIIAIESGPCKQSVPTLQGRIVLADVPDRYNLMLTIRSKAMVTANNITIGPKEIRIGAQMQVRTDRISSSGIVSGIVVRPKE